MSIDYEKVAHGLVKAGRICHVERHNLCGGGNVGMALIAEAILEHAKSVDRLAAALEALRGADARGVAMRWPPLDPPPAPDRPVVGDFPPGADRPVVGDFPPFTPSSTCKTGEPT